MSYSSLVLADNPLAFWKLADAGATVADSSGHGHDGTVAGALNQGLASLLPADPADHSTGFGGAGSVGFGNPAALQLGTGTLELWIKSTNPSARFEGILVKGGAASLYHDTNGQLGMFDWSGGNPVWSGVNVCDGQPHHVVVVFDSGVAGGSHFYIDGVDHGAFTAGFTGQGGDIGLGGGSGQEFHGTVQMLAIYGTKLSGSRVAAHHTGGIATMPTFDAWWADPTNLKGALMWDRHPDGQDVKETARAAAVAVSGVAEASSLIPDHGPVAGGTVVSIFGDGFTGATAVHFGATIGTAFSVVNDHEVKVTAPAHAAGVVDVIVNHPNGDDTLAAAFTYA